MGARRYWVDWFPVQRRVLDGIDPEKVLLVDVGGGKGHDVLAFQARFPGRGRLVVQDLEVKWLSNQHQLAVLSWKITVARI